MLGGGGLVAANVYASATEGGPGGGSARRSRADRTPSSGAVTIDCLEVGGRLAAVPDGARSEVDNELAALDRQTAEAYQRLQSSTRAMAQDSGFADSAITGPLKEKRAATIERIAIAVDRVGDRPEGLETPAACTTSTHRACGTAAVRPRCSRSTPSPGNCTSRSRIMATSSASSTRMMREMVDCINTGRQCEAGSSNCEDPENSPSPTADPPSEETDEPGPAPTDTPSENETPEPSPSPSMSDRTPDPASAPPAKKPAEAGPRACTSPLATQRAESAVSPTDDGDGGIGSAATADEGNGDDSAARPAPQAVTGDLAGTGTRLRPAALGALLLIVGFLLLRRVRQESR